MAFLLDGQIMSDKGKKSDPITDEAKSFTVRPAQPGDLCLLLVPTGKAELQALKERQQALCTHLGGKPVALVHLTCQRFSGDEQHLPHLIERLERAAIGPVIIHAVGSETLYSPFRGNHLLKWRAEVSEPLKQAIKLIRQNILTAGFQPLYSPDAVPSLVTALTDLPEGAEKLLGDIDGMSGHLFTGNCLILSRINGPEEYETLATLRINELSL